ncbi:MAG: DNA alkylation repair protein [Bacteroidota bacterium]
MESEIVNRKGARKVQDVPEKVLHLLNKGEIETVNLTEWLAIDHLLLVQHVFPNLGLGKNEVSAIVQAIQSNKKATAMNRTRVIGTSLYERLEDESSLEKMFEKLSTHSSDAIRAYAPFLIGLNDKLDIEQKLEKARALIADKHFGVREVVWMALRPEIDQHLDAAIQFLSTWTSDQDENIRRFITESTRPRGVWCKHIERLKEHPELALSFLDPLKADGSKYVQDSVGNWLNDASKTKPQFVIDLCDRWEKESPRKETIKIIKRARRTIDKMS